MTSLVVGTAGHIDHGKSSLVLALTGTDPDRLKEEKARGITIDLGFAHTAVGDLSVSFVDVPGHERFVRNMLAGAGGLDAVLLVIAADESVMPQTREHFQICRLLRLRDGIIVLTKIDAADEDMRALARMEARELTAGSFLEAAPVVEVSARTGEGLDALRTALAALGGRVAPRPVRGATRLPVDRAFSMKGFGTVVTGTLLSGSLAVDGDYVLLPGGRGVKVRGLQVHGRAEPAAAAGRRVAVNLAGLGLDDVRRGDTVAAPGALTVTARADVRLELLADARPLKHGARVRFHQGTTERLGRVALVPPREGATELAPGASAFARVRLEAPAAITRGYRFILRAYSPAMTIGGGVVLDPQPPSGALRAAAGAARLARLDEADSDCALAWMIEEAGAAGLPAGSLTSRGGVPPEAAAQTAARLTATGRAIAVGDRLLAPAVLERLTEALLALLHTHHAAEPLSEGLPREEARARLFGRAPTAVFEAVVAGLARSGRVVARERLALAGRGPSLSDEDADARDALECVYRDAGLAPPDAAAAAAAAGVDKATADRVGRLLIRDKRLIKIDTLLFHQDALGTLKADVRAMKEAGAATLDVAAFKARFGVSRKFAIPLLEYLDRERVTRRAGESRIVL